MTQLNTPPRRTQAQRRADAESRLLQAAAELIGEIGPSRVTLARIGERAGYSRGIVNHHFGSKAALMERLVEVVQTDFAAACVPSEPTASPVGEIIELVRTFVGMLEDLPPIHRAFLVLWADATATSPELRAPMARSDRRLRAGIAKAVERGIADGTITDEVRPPALAACLVGELRGLALQALIAPDDIDLGKARAEMERALLASLTS